MWCSKFYLPCVIIFWSYFSVITQTFSLIGSWSKSLTAWHGVRTQLCPALWDPMDCSLPESSVHGIVPVRIVEWIAISSSSASSQHRDQTYISCIQQVDSFTTTLVLFLSKLSSTVKNIQHPIILISSIHPNSLVQSCLH